MTTSLAKVVRRELCIAGRAYIVVISPAGLKLTLKGRRKGLELAWTALIDGDAALAAGLNASLGRLAMDDTGRKQRRASDSSGKTARRAVAQRGR
jgi:hypothetical protein